MARPVSEKPAEAIENGTAGPNAASGDGSRGLASNEKGTTLLSRGE